MGRVWWIVRLATLGVAVALLSFTGVAQARSWMKWAPDPLASDSSYEAMRALPADSLDVDELAWFDVQRDWRGQRRGDLPHRARENDGRFAALASRPYADLTDKERAWLVTENAAQRVGRDGHAGGIIVGVVIAALAGAAIAIVVIGNALENAFGH